MRGRRARIGLQGFVVVEQPDRQAAPPEQPRAQQADRPAAGNQYPPFVNHVRKTAVYLFPRASAIPTATRYNSSEIEGSKKRGSVTHLKIRNS